MLSVRSRFGRLVTSSMDGTLRVMQEDAGEKGKTVFVGAGKVWTMDLHPSRVDVCELMKER